MCWVRMQPWLSARIRIVEAAARIGVVKVDVFELYITNLIWPSALVGPGGWRQRWILPSLPLTGTKPFLPAASFSMLLGTSHHGLRMTPDRRRR